MYTCIFNIVGPVIKRNEQKTDLCYQLIHIILWHEQNATGNIEDLLKLYFPFRVYLRYSNIIFDKG